MGHYGSRKKLGTRKNPKQTLNGQRIQDKQAWKNPYGNILSINNDLKAFNFGLGQSEKDYDRGKKGKHAVSEVC